MNEREAIEAACTKMYAALKAVRQELWVDYCLAHNTTQPNPEPFNSRPVIRIIDEALQ